MTGTDTAFLKEEVGPVLARGIAETVVALPDDPVHYLGMWLKHYIKEKEVEAKERLREEELKKQREAWNKARIAKEKSAMQIIQKEWKEHLKSKEEAVGKENELRSRLEAFGEQLDEDGQYDPEALGYDACADQEAKEDEKERELDMLRAERLFQRWKLYVCELTKENIAAIKQRQRVDDMVLKIMRCVFYLTGKLTPSRLSTWVQVRGNIKPHPLLEQMKTFDPTTAKKRNVIRVKRVLTHARLTDEAVKESGQAVYVIAQWLWAVVEWRCLRDEVFKMKKEAGKEIPGMDGWEEDAGEEEEGEERDEDEEQQKAVEEAERAKEQEAGGEEGDEGEGDEE